ncbi:hypothetical protein BFK02_004551 [Salmonella enterica subsp. enterica serovar Java]|nr:hypothetical protein [Salmonella enterica subsp. enterica serovar Hvittingfoss]EBU5257428.1 hypothetical protein [Salmonella enterica]EBU9251874.1 hypothetical protein [Salmonella enterica subsp. enterica serovar Oslo]ECG2030562.1 hypothetical protein [Salmonella enterica subsp. enterica serovar Hato]EDS8307569.1 hypothetical protein [Salmonella enterica subsp. enterica serovar Java]EGI5335881.1 hypothetical protein [Salmonella enterica subsp. enterica serovar Caracas]
MPFNKNRFFRFHYHALDNYSTGEMLSFPGITYVKWQKLISRRYTRFLIGSVCAYRAGVNDG